MNDNFLVGKKLFSRLNVFSRQNILSRLKKCLVDKEIVKNKAKNNKKLFKILKEKKQSIMPP